MNELVVVLLLQSLLHPIFLLDGGVNRRRTRLRVENLVLVVVVVAFVIVIVVVVVVVVVAVAVVVIMAADADAGFDLGRRLWAKTFKTWSVSNLWERHFTSPIFAIFTRSLLQNLEAFTPIQ